MQVGQGLVTYSFDQAPAPLLTRSMSWSPKAASEGTRSRRMMRTGNRTPDALAGVVPALRFSVARLASTERTKVLLPAPGSPRRTRRGVRWTASRAVSKRVHPRGQARPAVSAAADADSASGQGNGGGRIQRNVHIIQRRPLVDAFITTEGGEGEGLAVGTEACQVAPACGCLGLGAPADGGLVSVPFQSWMRLATKLPATPTSKPPNGPEALHSSGKSDLPKSETQMSATREKYTTFTTIRSQRRRQLWRRVLPIIGWKVRFSGIKRAPGERITSPTLPPGTDPLARVPHPAPARASPALPGRGDVHGPQLCHVGSLLVPQQPLMYEFRIEAIFGIAQGCGELPRPLALCLGQP